MRLADSVVANVINAENTDEAPDGCVLIDCLDTPCGPGWLWDGVGFVNPNPPPPDEEA